MTRPLLPLALCAPLLCLSACGGAEATSDPHAPARGHHGHGHGGDPHASAGHGHGHAHGSPEELGPLMRELHGLTAQVRAALVAGDVAAVAGPATAVARACDDEQVHDLDPVRFGPRFAELDGALHATSEELAQAAAEGDLARTRALYAALLERCNACHAQAPTAGHVDLGALAAP